MTAASVQSAAQGGSGKIAVADLGQGYDRFAGSARSAAVTGDVSSPGSVVHFKYTLSRGSSRFAEAINVSADISAGMEFFDSVSFKSTLYQSLDLTETSVSLVLYAANIKTTVYNPVRLIPDIKPPTEESAAGFFYGHGDSYVGQIDKGGEFIAIYTFYTETFNAQADLTTRLSASGISEDGEINATVTAAIQLTYEQFKLRKSLKSLLVGYKGVAPTSVEEIIEFGRQISARDPDNPTVLNYGLIGYETVPGFPPVPWQAIIDNRELFMSSLAPDRSKLRLLRNQLRTILEVYDYYGVEVDRADVSGKRDTVDTAISQLETLVNQIDRQPAVIVEKPKSTELDSLTWGTPTLNYSQVDSQLGLPKMGGDGGDVFTDVQLADVLTGTRVAALQLKGDKKIDQLITTYTDRHGTRWTKFHAEGGGHYSLEIELEPAQRLQYIYGTVGDNVVTWLEFWFQKNVVLQYPSRTIKGVSFEYRFA